MSATSKRVLAQAERGEWLGPEHTLAREVEALERKLAEVKELAELWGAHPHGQDLLAILDDDKGET